MQFETWVYPDGLVDGEQLEPPDELLAAQSLTEGLTIEHAASAAVEHDFLNREELVDPLLPADLVREYCVALRQHGSVQPFRLFRGVVRVVVSVGPVEEVTGDPLRARSIGGSVESDSTVRTGQPTGEGGESDSTPLRVAITSTPTSS